MVVVKVEYVHCCFVVWEMWVSISYSCMLSEDKYFSIHEMQKKLYFIEQSKVLYKAMILF